MVVTVNGTVKVVDETTNTEFQQTGERTGNITGRGVVWTKAKNKQGRRVLTRGAVGGATEKQSFSSEAEAKGSAVEAGEAPVKKRRIQRGTKEGTVADTHKRHKARGDSRAQHASGKVQDSGPVQGFGGRTGLEDASSESSLAWDKRPAERATVEFVEIHL